MELNRRYIIRVLLNGQLLTYTGKIIFEDLEFVSFIDKFGSKVSVNKKTIQSYEEVRHEYSK